MKQNLSWAWIARWRTALRKRIFERDNYTCRTCGYNPNTIIIGKKMQLHIHHIDKNRKNNADRNLITLCHSCHSKLHYRERVAVDEEGGHQGEMKK